MRVIEARRTQFRCREIGRLGCNEIEFEIGAAHEARSSSAIDHHHSISLRAAPRRTRHTASTRHSPRDVRNAMRHIRLLSFLTPIDLPTSSPQQTTCLALARTATGGKGSATRRLVW